MRRKSMRVIVAGFFALAIAGAQAAANPPQTPEGQITLIGAFIVAISALAYVVKVQYAENRAKEKQVNEDAKAHASDIKDLTEKYAVLMERTTNILDRIEERDHK
jgi:membrane protein implicated in regulation of membrane protease activity